MDEIKDNLPDRIAFIADAHLGMPGDNPERSEKVTTFLRWLNGKVSHLYIAGDLFDFWFEYKHAVPNTSPRVIFELYNLVRSGTEVMILAGNHDYWLGEYIRKEVGLKISLNDVKVVHQNQKLYIHHGDGLYPDDNGYRILKKILRSKISISLFRLIHPDIASWIARITSKTSRYYFAPPVVSEKSTALFRPIADERLKENYDAVIYGHSHVPLLEKRENGRLILLGDWIKYSTYVILENGNFTINNWE
ncbi:UDP-2,3-diacylglucosamine diphosphatase [Candidatus Latescibacterota bacterium]